MAASACASGGHEAAFVEPVSERFICSICYMVLKDPILTSCGHHFCSGCLARFCERRPQCASCRSPLDSSKTFLNNALKREILDLKIKCDLHEKGCEWIGELRSREDHKTSCGYVDELCDNCGQRVRRMKKTEHDKRECQIKEAKCEYCNVKLARWRDLEPHYTKCYKYPVKCVYNCGEMVPRYQMANHADRDGTCPNSIIDCEFKHSGCWYSGKREDLRRHTESHMGSHLAMVANDLAKTKAKLNKAESQLAIIGSCGRLSVDCPFEFVQRQRIENWSQVVLDSKAGRLPFVDSELFFVPPGYHMLISSYPNKEIHNECYLGVLLFAVPGNFDSIIKWPFPFSFTMEIEDQQDNGRNIICKFYPPYGNELKDSQSIGRGVEYFASHEKLESRCYIKDNAVSIKVTIDVR